MDDLEPVNEVCYSLSLRMRVRGHRNKNISTQQIFNFNHLTLFPFFSLFSPLSIPSAKAFMTDFRKAHPGRCNRLVY